MAEAKKNKELATQSRKTASRFIKDTILQK